MRAGRRSLVGAVGAAALAAGFLGAAPPALAAEPTVPFISEIHYDNTGTDAGEFVEVQIPAGTTTAGLAIVLYNGGGTPTGGTYDTDALPPVTAPAGSPAVAVIDYPANGIQNGSPDGLALVSGTTVIEFLSYEGTILATNGAANGMTSTDIGVLEDGNGPVGESLSKVRNSAGSYLWQASAPNTKGLLNSPTGPPVDNAPTVTATTPTDGASGVAESANLTVTFSELVDVTDGAFTVACGGADQALSVTGSGTSYTVNPDADLPTGLLLVDRARRERDGHRHQRPAGQPRGRLDRDVLDRHQLRHGVHVRLRDPGFRRDARHHWLGDHRGRRGRRLRGPAAGTARLLPAGPRRRRQRRDVGRRSSCSRPGRN